MTDSNTNSINHDDDDLTPTQEYVIAGGVILLFGLLYWFINHGWNSDADLSVANTQLPKSELSTLDTNKNNTNTGLQATALGTAAVLSSQAKPAIETPTPVKPDPVQANAAVPSIEAVEEDKKIAEKASTPNFQVKATPKTPDKLAEVAQLETAKHALKKTEAETTKAAEEVKTQAEAMSTPTNGTNEQEKNQQNVASEGSVYTLPDGTEVTISPDGFEDAFKQLIESKEINKPITFDSIYFDTGSIKINAKSDHQIKATAALLHKHPDIKILLRGHTDNTGFQNTNLQLSLLRANAMGVALGRLGIDTRRIQVTAMGASQPIASNDTEEGRKKNRRIEVLIIE